MRKFLFTSFIVSAVLVMSYFFQGHPDLDESISVGESKGKPASSEVQQPELIVETFDVGRSSVDTREPLSSSEIEAVDEVELLARRDELLSLIEEYDQNLHDREMRAEIEARAALAAESYKRQVLAKVKNEQ